MRFAIFLAGFVIAGCGLELRDPCAGVKGSCLALQIERNDAVQAVDDVVVTVTAGDGVASSSTADDGRRSSLPLGVAVIFDAAPPTGSSTAAIAATFEGRAFASTPQSFTLAAGEHRTLYVTLHAVTATGDGAAPADLAAWDLAPPVPPDMAGSDLVCVPITVCPATVGCGSISNLCGGTLSCAGTCQLNAIEPSTANTGAIVTLEGTFGATAMVNFPGGIQQLATVLGANRAQVVVPDGATAGDLTVTTGGATLGPFAFHRAPYKLGLRPFAAEPEQASGGAAPAYVTLEAGASAIIGKRLYLVGGMAGRNYFVPVSYATVGLDGSLTNFGGDSAIVLSTPRYSHTLAHLGNFLYVVGGVSRSGTLLASVESSTVSADDSISTFTPVAGVNLQTARSEQMSVVLGSYLYQIGGFNGGPLADVERATINPDGSLSTFETVTGLTLTTPRRSATAIVLGDRLFVIGGLDGQPLATIESAPIGADGSLGAFTLVDGVTLTTARTQHHSVVIGDSVYVLGGSDSTGNSLASVERASFTGDTLSTFTIDKELAMTGVRTNAQYEIVGDHLVAMGGWYTPTGGWWSSSEQASIDDSGDLGNFEIVDGVSLTTPRAGHTSFVAGNRIYVVGGSTGIGALGDVESATISADGSMTTFTPVPGISLVTPRIDHIMYVLPGVVYVAGGWDGSKYLSSVESAQLNSDGTFASSFATAATDVALTTPAGYARSVVLSYDLSYIIGGSTGTASSYVDSSYVGQGGLDGPGDLASSKSATLVQARDSFVSALFENNLYVIGGYSFSAGYLNSVEVNALDPVQGALTTFTTAPIALNTARESPSSFVLGRSLYVAGGHNGNSPVGLSSIEKADADATGTLGAFTPVATAFNAARYAHTSNVVGDYVYVIGGGPYVTNAVVERAKRK